VRDAGFKRKPSGQFLRVRERFPNFFGASSDFNFSFEAAPFFLVPPVSRPS
jgi:hypothetical protein